VVRPQCTSLLSRFEDVAVTGRADAVLSGEGRLILRLLVLNLLTLLTKPKCVPVLYIPWIGFEVSPSTASIHLIRRLRLTECKTQFRRLIQYNCLLGYSPRSGSDQYMFLPPDDVLKLSTK
jgi:hypothetical protein